MMQQASHHDLTNITMTRHSASWKFAVLISSSVYPSHHAALPSHHVITSLRMGVTLTSPLRGKLYMMKCSRLRIRNGHNTRCGVNIIWWRTIRLMMQRFWLGMRLCYYSAYDTYTASCYNWTTHDELVFSHYVIFRFEWCWKFYPACETIFLIV
jgi:hypothetical protein